MPSRRKSITVGDTVTCKTALPCYNYEYYRRQHGEYHPVTQCSIFMPGMVGTVAAIAPKVRIMAPIYNIFDTQEDFLVVDYDTPYGTERVGLNYCNAVRIKRGELQ